VNISIFPIQYPLSPPLSFLKKNTETAQKSYPMHHAKHCKSGITPSSSRKNPPAKLSPIHKVHIFYAIRGYIEPDSIYISILGNISLASSLPKNNISAGLILTSRRCSMFDNEEELLLYEVFLRLCKQHPQTKRRAYSLELCQHKVVIICATLTRGIHSSLFAFSPAGL
jgi:hypothetical protein